MDRSPLTDKDMNIPPRGSEKKFRELRHRAKEVEEVSRHRKSHRNKHSREYKYKIGDVFVSANNPYRHSPHFYLVDVLDYKEESESDYYCILKMTTDPDYMERIGRIVTVSESHGWLASQLTDANVENKKIKWLVAG